MDCFATPTPHLCPVHIASSCALSQTRSQHESAMVFQGRCQEAVLTFKRLSQLDQVHLQDFASTYIAKHLRASSLGVFFVLVGSLQSAFVSTGAQESTRNCEAMGRAKSGYVKWLEKPI